MPSGFSDDGYIIDQNCFSHCPYRGTTSDINGCGWIAAFNLRRAMGQLIPYETVNRQMDAMFPLKIPGPTPMRVLRRYLRQYLSFQVARGKKAAEAAAANSRAGILRYWEGKEPHYITFVRADGALFRFFNVADGQEEISDTIELFFRLHCHKGWIRVLITV